MTEKSNKIENHTVYIIITPAEYITKGKEFYDKGIFKIIPVRSVGIKKAVITILITAAENIGKETFWVRYQ